MTQPLSPLSPSFGNSRGQSPAYAPPSTVRRRGIDEIMSSTDQNDKENAPPKPAKRAFCSYDENDDDYELKASTTPARSNNNNNVEADIGDDMTVDLADGPPSSPFQYEARDDTVDMNRLQAMTMPTASSTTTVSPKKQGPEIYVDEEDRIDEPIVAGREPISTETYESHGQATEPDHTTTMSDNDDTASVLHHEPKHADNSTISHSYMEMRHNEEMSTVAHILPSEEESHPNDNDAMDDTCFSTFSAVPNVDMTMFSKLVASPTKKIGDIQESPAVDRTPGYSRRSKATTPATARRRRIIDDTSPTPQRKKRDDSINLLDFNDSFNYFHRVSQRFSMSSNRASMSPRRRSPLKQRDPTPSPTKYNLIDFDLPPPATPMSIPSITPRELESLKSGFMSEISSLKASLSGKEAEVSSLKQAVADAERRVGEALEEARNEAIHKEALEVEQVEWQRRGKEMESVLREVRAEIIDGERERERLSKKSDEAEKRKEQLEGRIVELESQLDAAKKAAATSPSATMTDGDGKSGMLTAEQSAKEVQEAVERVARELHTLYKGKHETKVAALKKSYEARWEKRVREAENKLRDVTEEIERLKTERDTTMSGPLNPNMSMMSVMGRDNEELETANKVLGAQIKGLEEQLSTLKRDNEQLYAELKMERCEKGELVAAVDEWLAMQQANTAAQPAAVSSREVSNSSSYYSASEQDAPLSSYSGSSSSQTSARKKSIDQQHVETSPKQSQQQLPTFKRSTSRSGPSSSALNSSSGLRPPSSGPVNNSTGIEKRSRLGIYSGSSSHVRHNSGGSSGSNGSGRSIAMPSTTPGRSGIMSSIERMGAGGR
ncbi:conserved hypothetical protein [Talaromyces stipitatus ATCC 10500]|uniref:Uncharacterized protein n=1 Tax=Talaromyces stipitatus (strain ATCC 10500 / CBS 375.48 / QM 6759 / NRRL 1006) TaxID=441959 RepID=B8MC41_TALSN|nr:uncharacterized protein TSTA_122230 [Talaromyces stipitatus ATCC 10500]EED18487.1 conserved hypothetical protein [Talaromyces stipitatus ATCC 10500]